MPPVVTELHVVELFELRSDDEELPEFSDCCWW